MTYPHHLLPSLRGLFTAALLAGYMLAPQQVFAQDPANHQRAQMSTIRVTGTGSVAIAPDIAIISLGVLRQAKTAREALDANSTAMAKVIAAMKAQNIADKDLQTSSFNIQPRYQYFKRGSNGGQRPPQITGYQVSNQLTVRVRDLKSVGKVLDEVVTLGINSGGNIQFTNDDPSEALKQARTKAMKDAVKKATTLTSAAGVSLGKIISINEQSSVPRPMMMAQARNMASDSTEMAVPVQAGENSYRVNVTVSWEIAQ